MSSRRCDSGRRMFLSSGADKLDCCVLQLAGVCDVLVENYLPGKLQHIGLGYEQLSRFNPQLIYCSISGTDSFTLIFICPFCHE